MYQVGWSYETGSGVDADVWNAADWSRRSIIAGSWAATIPYARLLEKLGHSALCDEVLQDGVDVGFATSRYWLASVRYWRAPTRKTAREVHTLLDQAIDQGHPGAELFFSHLLIKGKFGLGRILEGVRRDMACIERYLENAPTSGQVTPASG